MHFTPKPLFILAALFSICGVGAQADCANPTITDSESNVLARLDAMASCIAAQHREIDQLRPLANAIIVSDAPCASLGEGWTRYSVADGRFLLGASDRFQAGSTGGEEAVTLSLSQAPPHSHVINTYEWGHTVNGNGQPSRIDVDDGPPWSGLRGFLGTNTVGSGQAHNNMPPYLTVRFCKRK